MKKHNYWRFVLRQSILPEHLSAGDTYLLDKQEEDLWHQLNHVLRAKIGDSIILMNKNYQFQENFEAHFRITSLDKKTIQLEFEKGHTIIDPHSGRFALALALPNKPAKLEMILKHCTELGVTVFKLITTDNSNYPHQLRMDRLESILQEAVEQSERARLPKVVTYGSLDQYFQLLDNTCYTAMERLLSEQQGPLQLTRTSDLDILIGPEGGFSEREVLLINEKTTRTFSLGKQILRTETAAIVSCGIFSLTLE